MKKKIVIGISGGIASGKSLVSEYLKNKGYKIYDCDLIAHEIFELQDTKVKIANTFNIDIKDVNRKYISKLAFNNNKLLESLNDIMKNKIISQMKEIINNNNGLIFFDAPLIYDWHLEDMFDRVIFVYVNKNIQELRLSQRDNIDLEYAKKKINSQIDIDEKYQLAKSRKDYIVDNNGTIDALNPQIDKILKEIENEI